MAGVSLSCECCAQPACCFALAEGVQVRVCQSHSSVLTDRHLLVYDIAATEFIQSEEDEVLYERRRELMQKGLENASALKERCNSDLVEGRKSLQAAKVLLLKLVESCFQELDLTLHQRQEVAMSELTAKNHHLAQLIVDKSFELSLTDTALCGDLLPGPLFRVVFGDCRLELAKLLLGQCYVLPAKSGMTGRSAAREEILTFAKEQAETGKADLAFQAAQCAKELGAEDYPEFELAAKVQKAEIVKQLVVLLPTTFAKEETLAVAAEDILASQTARKTGDYASALKILESHMDQLRDIESPEWNLELGIVWAHFGRCAEADETLRKGLDLELASNPASQLALQLSLSLVEVYYQTGKLEAAVSMCEWMLNSGAESTHSFELLCSLYYLFHSQCQRDNLKEASDASLTWLGKLAAKCPRSQCVLQLIQAEIMRQEETLGPEASEYETALESAEQLLPNSLLFARSKECLGHFYHQRKRWDRSKLYWQHVCQIYLLHYPQSLCFAECCVNLSAILPSEQSEELCKLAHTIYTEHFADDANLALCLANLGGYSVQLNKLQEAEEYLIAAYSLLNQKESDSFTFALCLTNLGGLYCNTNRTGEAEELLLRACDIFSAEAPRSQIYGMCLLNLGAVYQHFGSLDRAESYLLKAAKRLEKGSLNEAMCLANLGGLHLKSGQTQRAETELLNAQKLLSMEYSHTLAFALCLTNLGGLYVITGNQGEAEELLQQACELLSETFPTSNVYPVCLMNLGSVYMNSGRLEQAEELMLCAVSLFKSQGSRSQEYALCLENLATLYTQIEQLTEAKEWRKQACQVYSLDFSQSITYAKCLLELGNLCKQMEELPEAEAQYSQAHLLLSEHFADSPELADCLLSLGMICQTTGRNEEAGTHLESALRLFESKRNEEEAAHCRSILELLNR